MPQLKKDLPDHLYWLTEKVESLVRPAAFLMEQQPVKGKQPEVARLGGTFHCGKPDVPEDAPWVDKLPTWEHNFGMSDGESPYFQLCLEDIPAEVRVGALAQLPAVGIVWITLDLSDHWVGKAYFDPRPSHEIPWRPRALSKTYRGPEASHFVLSDTLTFATDEALPEIASDYQDGFGMCADYDNWFQDVYGTRGPSDTQVGGWLHPIQGDTDQLRKTLVLAVEDCVFGDAGAYYLHYSPEKGFWVYVETH